MYATNVPTAVHSCLYIEGAQGHGALAHYAEMESRKMGHIMEQLDPRQLVFAVFPDDMAALATWQAEG